VWIFGGGLAAECVRAAVASADFQGFCVDTPTGDAVLGAPVSAIRDVLREEANPTIFVATGYKALNHDRANALERLRAQGVILTSVVSSPEPSLSHGQNCFVMADASVHPYVRLGDNVFVWGGAAICHHVRIGNHVWVTAGATIAGNTSIGDNVFIGANATVVSGVSIGSNVFIGAGSLITSDVPDNVAVATRPSSRIKVDAQTFVEFLEQKGSF